MKSFRKTKIFTVYNTNLTDMSLYNLTDIWSVICVAGDVLVTFSDCSQPQLLTNIKVLITNDIKRFHSFLQYTCELRKKPLTFTFIWRLIWGACAKGKCWFAKARESKSAPRKPRKLTCVDMCIRDLVLQICERFAKDVRKVRES